MGSENLFSGLYLIKSASQIDFYGFILTRAQITMAQSENFDFPENPLHLYGKSCTFMLTIQGG